MDFFDLRSEILSRPLGTKITLTELHELGVGDAELRRLTRWNTLKRVSRGLYEVSDEVKTPSEPRKRWPGEAEWRARGIETRRKNNLDMMERKYLMATDWLRKYHRAGTRFRTKELDAMRIDYTLLQRLIRNGYLKPVQRGLYEVL